MKVFTVVLRAALVAPAGGGTENRSSLGNNNDNNSSKSEEEGAPRAHSPIRRDPQPTMRRSLPSATVINREAVGSGCAKPQLTSAREARRLLLVSECDTEVDKPNRNENDDNSPSPEAPHEKAVRRKSIVDDRRGTSEGSLGLSCSAEAATVEKKKTKKTPYDPLKGCTFAPAINKKIYRTSSAHLVSAEKEKQGEKAGEQQSRRKVPGVVPYKSKEEREMEECTFAPETARFHKGRDSLAWWTREPFIGRSGETTSSIAAEEERSIDGSACDGVSSRPQQQQQQQRQVWASRASPVPLTIGFDKAVQRMMEARKKCRPKFEEMLRSTNEEPHKPLRPTVVEPFTLHAEARHLRREHQKPVLYVDVDLPSGKTGRIGVHRGDKAADLARGFAHAYRLGDELRERLECVLTEKINELLRENVRTLWL
ncbi:hypothetical protein DQ04_07141020 [Trypanosoma grayi]|uniref:hypothetical protein n=1 Tax=Trypanosoma grayi TaxID=71804 RepID=UPI0004F47111|nr:hypothetical protein DQ04_07141020 [Trypanosoma grayi]KEG08459.1 hypothetical protein DQ04_07141020 [Trypanosoma grayi]